MKQWDTATLPVAHNRAFRQQYARVRARYGVLLRSSLGRPLRAIIHILIGELGHARIRPPAELLYAAREQPLE
jgi:hypothetical protein